jgi:alpha-N-arabinofuranosidase
MKRAVPRKWRIALPLIAAGAILCLVQVTRSQSVVPMPPTAVNLLVNADLAKVANNLPESWYFDRAVASKGSVRIEASGSKPGSRSLCLAPNSRNTDGNQPLALAQMIYPEPFLNHKLVVQASMKVTGGATAYGHLFALSRGKPVAHASVSQTRGESGFVLQQDSLTVPASTDQIFFFAATSSTSGHACFDDLAVFVADPDTPTPPMSFRRPPAAPSTTATLPAVTVSSTPPAVRRTAAPQSAPAPAAPAANILHNPEFRHSGNVPDEWLLDNALASKGSVSVDPNGPRSGQAALCLTPNRRNSDKSKPFGLAQIFPAAPYRGKNLTVHAALRVTQGGTAFVHLFAVAGGRPVGQVTFNQDSASASFEPQEGHVGIPESAENLLFAVTTNSTGGTACFSDLFVGEGSPAAAAAPAAPHPVAAGGGAAIRVNAANTVRRVPAGLFGTNVEWVRNGNGIWDSSTNRPNPEVVRRLREAGTSLIRYPGGGLADHFHWRDSIGPMASRPVRPHVLDPESSKLVFGMAEFMDLCRMVGAEPLITVNITSGTPQEAADWVAYCNRANNPEREKNGSRAPYKVRYWEIGNEQYISNPASGLPNSYLPPDVYARRYQEFVTAMKAVDPTIVVGAIGGLNFGRYHQLQDDNWDAKVFSAEARSIDFLSIHNGYSPLVGSTPGVQFYDVYKAMMAFPAQVEANLGQLARQLDSYGAASRNTKIAVTEWGPLFAAETTSAWVGHTKTLGSALYVAGLLNSFLRSPRVDMATYLKVTEDNYMGWLYPNGDPKPVFDVLTLYWQHLGTRLLDTKVTSPGFSSPALGSVAAASNTPYLDAVGGLNDSGSRLTLIVVNRDFDNPWSTSIQIDGFQPAPNAKAWVLTADKLDANNGEDLDARLKFVPQAQAPDGGLYSRGRPGTVVPRERAVNGISPAFYYTFPSKSVTVLEFASR